MRYVLALSILLALVGPSAHAQEFAGSILGTEGLGDLAEQNQSQTGDIYRHAQVANFARDGSKQALEERLSFWNGPRGQAVEYSAGDSEPTKLLPLSYSANGFSVLTPDGTVWDIMPKNDVLVVSDRAGIKKRFEWLYEGPIEGRGTFCSSCVDQADAVNFVRKHFMR